MPRLPLQMPLPSAAAENNNKLALDLTIIIIIIVSGGPAYYHYHRWLLVPLSAIACYWVLLRATKTHTRLSPHKILPFLCSLVISVMTKM